MRGQGATPAPLPVVYRGYMLRPLKFGRYMVTTTQGEKIDEATCLDHAKALVDDWLRAR